MGSPTIEKTRDIKIYPKNIVGNWMETNWRIALFSNIWRARRDKSGHWSEIIKIVA